ncbi:MAG: hypothetical protein V2A54_05670 [Bacteroidota bacterium]
MKIKLIILFTLSFHIVFCQDTIRTITLKPISEMPLIRMMSLGEIKKQNDFKSDSINNSSFCKKKRKMYEDSCAVISMMNLEAIKLEVLDLNSKNTGFYYYVYCSDDIPAYYYCEGCAGPQGPIICDLTFKIGKKEFSHIILDGPSGEVFYYDDIRKMAK